MPMAKCRECGNPVSTEAKSCPSCGVASPTKKPVSRWVLYPVLAVLIFWIIGRLGSTTSGGRPTDDRPGYLPNLSVDASWHLGGFDNVMVADLTIANKGDRAVKDLAIHCDISGKSGTAIDAVDQVIYDTVGAGQTRTFKDVNMGIVNTQSERAGCEIGGFTWR